MGLAVYNGIILDIHFPPICYQKLLSPAVVPYNDVNAVVGVRTVTLDDLRQVSPVSIRFCVVITRAVSPFFEPAKEACSSSLSSR